MEKLHKMRMEWGGRSETQNKDWTGNEKGKTREKEKKEKWTLRRKEASSNIQAERLTGEMQKIWQQNLKEKPQWDCDWDEERKAGRWGEKRRERWAAVLSGHNTKSFQPHVLSRLAGNTDKYSSWRFAQET